MRVDVEQRSEDWFTARCGSLGASQVADALSRTKSGYSATRTNLRLKLALERLTGKQAAGFTSAAMQHGIDTENEARIAYSFEQNVTVTEMGLVRHSSIPWTHSSPDGLVGDDGLVEIKCRQPAGHLETLTSGEIPSQYVTQMNWQLACMPERQWVDYVCYNPDFPEDLKLFIKRHYRNDEQILELEKSVCEFLAEVETDLETINSIRRRVETGKTIIR
jgi:putative phage-type endonuclease